MSVLRSSGRLRLLFLVGVRDVVGFVEFVTGDISLGLCLKSDDCCFISGFSLFVVPMFFLRVVF